MKISSILTFISALICLSLSACNPHKEVEAHEEHHKIVLTSPEAKDITITQQYVCQIHSQRHIEVVAMEAGRLDEIPIREGQAVKKGELMFKVLPAIYKFKLEAEMAEVQFVQMEFNNTERLYKDNVVAQTEVQLYKAKLEKAKAKAKLAEAELNFATIPAPFDGVIDRLLKQQGTAIKEGEILTTLSDNSVMWVHFNVPEARYFEDMASYCRNEKLDSQSRIKGFLAELNRSAKIELMLANGSIFPQTGKLASAGGKFNTETGTTTYRADFPNPDGLLRHGQTGTVLIHRTLKNALVIPQRATFEILDKRYVWVVGKDHVVHQREIVVENEMDDIFIIKSGLNVADKIVLEGVRQVHEGEKVEAEYRKPEEVMANQKNHAE